MLLLRRIIDMVRKALAIAAGMLGLAAAAQAASPPPAVPNCGTFVVRPASITIACGDGNYFLRSLRWSKWGGTTAEAIGTAVVNTCTPYCAAGKFRSYPAGVTLDRLATCGTRRFYSRLIVAFTKTIPAGLKRRDVIATNCKA